MSWVCPMCSTSNEDSSTNCMVCDAHKPDKTEVEERSLLPEDEYKIGLLSFQADDYTGAFNSFTYAADAEYPPAENELGRCYYLGKGTEKNISSAFYWFSKAAGHDDPAGLYNLGCCYYYGRDVA